ncbi:TPA: ATP-binding protein [Escherichia coli]|nr:ATP-binding protein [Escherichia coli]MBC0584396.1 ATP-binding protein [Escherichia coli]HBE7275812.1 ATP-binding protein [Escherichia coli]HDY1788562.1 ATP-binding protein [Escherichia coli]
MPRKEARLFFRLLKRQYEKARIVLTSNKGFANWGEMLGDNVLATVIPEHLLHHSTTLNIKGKRRLSTVWQILKFLRE